MNRFLVFLSVIFTIPFLDSSLKAHEGESTWYLLIAGRSANFYYPQMETIPMNSEKECNAAGIKLIGDEGFKTQEKKRSIFNGPIRYFCIEGK